jgi:hypothetical protein
MDLASADTARWLDDAPGVYDCAPSYADTGGSGIFARLRWDRTCGVQVASELYIRHDNSATPEHNVCCACDSRAPRDFVARILGSGQNDGFMLVCGAELGHWWGRAQRRDNGQGERGCKMNKIEMEK